MNKNILTVIVGIVAACIGLYFDSYSLMGVGCIVMLVGRFLMERNQAKADIAARARITLTNT